MDGGWKHIIKTISQVLSKIFQKWEFPLAFLQLDLNWVVKLIKNSSMKAF